MTVIAGPHTSRTRARLALVGLGLVLALAGYGSGIPPGGAVNRGGGPQEARLLAAAGVTAVGGGQVRSVALTSAGQILAWGELFNVGPQTRPLPVRLPPGTTAASIVAGGYHDLVLTTSGQLLAFGANGEGELGDGTGSTGSAPVPVALPLGVAASSAAAGYWHSFALTASGQLFAWGWNEYGQLGTGTTDIADPTPAPVDLPLGTSVSGVSGGAVHSLALTSTGELWGWGNNGYGQLGDGTTLDRSLPGPVPLPLGTTVTAISSGANHNLALTSTGQLLAWGDNEYGQLGDGTTTNRSEPAPVDLPAGTTVKAFVAAGGQNLVLTATGQLLSWGDNEWGQLGDGTTTNRPTPISVSLPAGATPTAIAGGNGHSLAIASSGQLYSWGWNNSGQLGDGSMEDRHAPVPVSQP